MRRIFIGDVQGCVQELEDLLKKLGFDPATDQLCLVGDLIRRGPESLATLKLLKSLDALFVLGNHEAHLLERGFFEDPSPDPSRWASLEDLCALPPAERESWGAYLRAAPLLRAWPDLLLVHAALPPALWSPDVSAQELAAWTDLRWDSPEDTPGAKSRADKWFVLSTRYCDASGRKSPGDWPPPDEPYAPWDSFYKAERSVVFGHWARRGRVDTPPVRGLDTGCVYGGSLTAWIAEEDRWVQVPARQAWIQV